MPDRWVRALGNAAEIHRGMIPVFTLTGAPAQAFVAALPPATGKNQSGWLTPLRTGAKIMPRRTPDSAFVPGLHRLSALKRLMTNLSGITVYMPADRESGAFMAQAELPFARITLSLTAEAWQGYSGEGSLLSALARPEVLKDAESIASALQFDAAIDEMRMARELNMDEGRVSAALAILAVSGKLGFDAHERSWFHRELPDDPTRVLKDNPRLVAAQKLANEARNTGGNNWSVRSNGAEYRVVFNPLKGAEEAKCTCTWYLNHRNGRGPCKHILAVQLREADR
jgi:hypothetical protein